jgi:hypothetical protein
MGRRQSRGLKPAVERFERRELLSAITDILITRAQPIHLRHSVGTTQPQANQANGPDSTVATQPPLMNPSVPPLIGPGPGDPTPRELARERFKAYFNGPFHSTPPRFTGQAKLLQFRGIGGSTQFIHGDYQMTIAIPKDPSASIVGNAYLQDRNINSSGQVGFDLTFDPQSLDRFGRPTRGTFTQDPNIYSGVYFVDTASGTVTIRYAKRAATVTFQGLMYTNGITDPLRNMDLQARGGRITARSAP